MWLMLSDCFLSIVSKDCARDELLVRARRKGDIEKVFPGATVSRNTRSDYLFRSVIKRDAVRAAMIGELDRITYSNFKDSVPKEEKELHDAYLRVWSTMADLQPTKPYFGFGSKDAVFNQSIRTAPIDDLFGAIENTPRITARAWQGLINNDIKTIGDLLKKDEAQLLRGSTNFGRKSLAEVRDALAEFGLKIGQDLD